MKIDAMNMVCLILTAAAGAYAEVGVSVGASINYKATFSTAEMYLSGAPDPGAAVTGVNHFYDDGYNLVDSSGNFGNQTTYWGYQNSAQDSGSSITMSSTRSYVEDAESTTSQDGSAPAIEVYWERDFFRTGNWDIGLRVAGYWQKLNFTDRYSSTVSSQTTSDSYSYSGTAPSAPFNGSYSGYNFLLSDIPVRTISPSSSSTIKSERSMDLDTLGLDVDATATWQFANALELLLTGGVSAIGVNGTFSYSDGMFSKGDDSDSDILFGLNMGCDIKYSFDDDIGLFTGVSCHIMSDYQQELEGRSATISFNDGLIARVGVFLEY